MKPPAAPLGGLIIAVDPGSLGEGAGLRPGDLLQSLNGQVLQDLIDYRYQVAEAALRIGFLRDGQAHEVTLSKEIDEDLGLAFESAVFDRVRECGNKCEFCFIHQQPKGLRESLYVEDDDYRLSFLQGNFITMTNMAPRDWERIERLHLSPLYVSVHTTNPELRKAMIKHVRGDKVLENLDRLVGLGIRFHAQIVLVPHRNDGQELVDTCETLRDRYGDMLLSVAVVPLGSSRYRADLNLPELTPSNPEWARETIRLMKPIQRRFEAERGDATVHLADEFYVLAGLPFPGVRHYGGFENLADGIGGARLLLWEWAKVAKRLPAKLEAPRRVTVVTGQAATSLLAPLVGRLNEVDGLEATLRPVPSRFWGDRITVTGLLMGSDVEADLRGCDLGDEVWLPDVVLRPGTDQMLDDLRVPELSARLGRPVRVLPTRADGFLSALGMDDAVAPLHLPSHGFVRPNQG